MTLPIWQWVLAVIGVCLLGYLLGFCVGYFGAKRKLK